MKKAIFAVLALLTVCAMVMVSCGGDDSTSDTYYTVKFTLGGATGTAPEDITKKKGESLQMPNIGDDVVAPAATPNFKGWQEDNGTTLYQAGSSYTPTADVIFVAQWSATPIVQPGPSEESIVEKFTLWNNVHPLFSFTLPEGKTWADYSTFKMDLKVADATDPLRHRIVGNYTAEEIATARIGVSDADSHNNIAVIASWPGGVLNRFIQYQAGGGTSGLEADFPGVDIVNNTFFTATLPAKDYSKANGDYNGGTNNPSWAVDGRKPDATATGIFVYGFGFCSQAGQGTTHKIEYEITNVKLVNDDGTEEVAGMPVYYATADGTKYRAFCGQLEDKGDDGLYTNTQNGKPEYTIVQHEDKIVPIKTDYTNPVDITITYDVNYPNDDTPPVIADAVQAPGGTIALPVPADPTTPPSTPVGNAWGFNGWYTAATDGIKISLNTIANADITVYAQWENMTPSTITFDVGNGGGSAPATEKVKKGTGLDKTKLGKGSATGTGAKTVFGGWYTTDTTAGAFDYKDYSKLVTTATNFSADATLYAYWYAPFTGYDSFAGTEDGVYAQWGTRIDEDGYFVFADGDTNSYLGANNNDTLIGFKWPTGEGDILAKKVRITYALKDIKVPAVESGWTADPAYAWKQFNSGTGSTTDNYKSWNPAATVASPKTAEKPRSDWTDATGGCSIQINKGDDSNNKQKRAGYIYGIKIISITYVD